MEIKINCYDCKEKVEVITEEKVFANGTKHIKATCPLCKRFIKWLPQEENNDMLYFGKHKGKRMSEVVMFDPDYLHWLCEETDKAKIRNLIEKTFYDYNKKLCSTLDRNVGENKKS